MGQVTLMMIIFISFLLLQGFAAPLNCSSPTPSSLFKELQKHLFSEKLVRPSNSNNNPLNVSLGITVVGILGVDEKTQTLSSVLWQVLEWDIYGLSWEQQRCGVKRVSVPRDQLWTPDIFIAEATGEDKSPKTTHTYLYNTGHVYDDQPISVVSSCKLVIYTFPFDIQNCSLTFGSYLHFADDIRMLPDSTPEEILIESKKVQTSNGEWELVGISVAETTLHLLDGDYSEIKYFLTLRRRPTLYVVNLLIPSCFLVTVDLVSFLLPPHSVDRSSFKMTLILGYTVFLLIMNDLLPVTGETTPLINIFFSISLALMVTSLLETIFITNIQFSSSQYSAVPRWLSVLILNYVAVVVCLPRKKKTSRLTICIKPSTEDRAKNISTTNSSEGFPQSSLDQLKPEKPPLTPPQVNPQEMSVDLLKKLSRDLTAIRSQVDKHFQSSNTSQEWQMIGIVVDRLLFCLYIIFILTSFIAIICIWSNSHKA
ncbi:5-hydroxytryptamine receptor 3A-like [Gouania willdenowi]|uniref:5-hydroxytryptamine receptor 3A-like n=1 Tax=Gouania willdenowi TaxID=441366 RepID=UPI0010554130|nr:5-hydroxytryptamine receptor 3A-like [Gouania willdenowi]